MNFTFSGAVISNRIGTATWKITCAFIPMAGRDIQPARRGLQMFKQTHAARVPAPIEIPHRRHRRWAIVGSALVCLALLGTAAGLTAYENPDFTAQAVDAARTLLGPQAIGLIESWFFQAQDRVRQAHYQATGDA